MFQRLIVFQSQFVGKHTSTDGTLWRMLEIVQKECLGHVGTVEFRPKLLGLCRCPGSLLAFLLRSGERLMAPHGGGPTLIGIGGRSGQKVDPLFPR